MTGRSPSGRAGRPTDHAPAGLGDTATIPNAIKCPSCGQDFTFEPQAILPDKTDMTLSLHVEKGQMIMLETLGGVLTSFAELQKAVGESLDIETGVFLAGLEITPENEVRITTRLCNVVKGRVSSQPDLFEQGADELAAAQRIEAGTDETLKAAQPEGQEPGPKDAP